VVIRSCGRRGLALDARQLAGVPSSPRRGLAHDCRVADEIRPDRMGANAARLRPAFGRPRLQCATTSPTREFWIAHLRRRWFVGRTGLAGRLERDSNGLVQ
jgi:hypothetical protein